MIKYCSYGDATIEQEYVVAEYLSTSLNLPVSEQKNIDFFFSIFMVRKKTPFGGFFPRIFEGEYVLIMNDLKHLSTSSKIHVKNENKIMNT